MTGEFRIEGDGGRIQSSVFEDVFSSCKAPVGLHFCCVKTSQALHWFQRMALHTRRTEQGHGKLVPSPSEEGTGTSTDLIASSYEAHDLNTLGAPDFSWPHLPSPLDSARPQDLARTSLWHLCRLLPWPWAHRTVHKSCSLSPQVHLLISLSQVHCELLDARNQFFTRNAKHFLGNS